jgi:acid phosphatase
LGFDFLTGEVYPLKKSLAIPSALLGLSGWLAAAQQTGAISAAAARPHPVFAVDAAAERIENVDLLKRELRAYHDCTCKCGCYARDLDAQANRAIAFLRRRAAGHRTGQKLAMILDIDETTLSNYQELASFDFTFNKPGFDAWADSARAPAIPGTVRLFDEARRLGVAAIFITGRGEEERTATERNLRAAGIDGWQQLIMRPAGMKDKTATVYKSAERAKIAAAGYTMILNVGDQWSDLRGAPEAEFNVKYPNPFYFLP